MNFYIHPKTNKKLRVVVLTPYGEGYKRKGTDRRLPAKIKSIVGPSLLLCGSVYVKISFSSDCKSTHYIFNNRQSEKKTCLCR